MEYAEDDYLMISGIQHFKFCRRQWALIHVEQQWAENEHTVIGELMHKKAHDPYLTEKRKDLLVVRALPVSSSIYPVEYKKGKPKHSEEDILQLTAQAMCLEEMFSTTVSEGAIFYGETRRREVVAITEELKNEVCQIFEEMHQYYDRRYTPKVKYSKACASCSLKEICLPKLEKAGSVKEYLKRALEEEPG